VGASASDGPSLRKGGKGNPREGFVYSTPKREKKGGFSNFSLTRKKAPSQMGERAFRECGQKRGGQPFLRLHQEEKCLKKNAWGRGKGSAKTEGGGGGGLLLRERILGSGGFRGRVSSLRGQIERKKEEDPSREKESKYLLPSPKSLFLAPSSHRENRAAKQRIPNYFSKRTSQSRPL